MTPPDPVKPRFLRPFIGVRTWTHLVVVLGVAPIAVPVNGLDAFYDRGLSRWPDLAAAAFGIVGVVGALMTERRAVPAFSVCLLARAASAAGPILRFLLLALGY